MEKVWEEELPTATPKSSAREKEADPGAKPPVPPRRRGLWSMASAFGERAASWGDGEKEKEQAKERIREKEKEREREKGRDRETTKENGKVLPPPPTHPSTRKAVPAYASPPPLPKRNEGRRIPPPVFNSVNDVEVKPSQAPLGVNGVDMNEEKTDDHLSPENVSIPTEDQPLAAPPAAEETETYLTPTEEVSSPFSPDPQDTQEQASETQAPLHSPTAVPLPTSPPETPTALPSNVASEGLVVPAGAGPSSASSPPPLPRRAAARAPRPISSLLASQAPSADATTPRAKTADDTSPTAATILTSEKNAEVSAGAPSSSPPVNPAESILDRTDGPGEPVAATEHVPQKKTTPETATLPKTNGDIGDESTAAAESPVSKPPSCSASPPVAATPTVQEDMGRMVPETNGRHDADGARDLATRAEDGGVYVGDATWEERTWKEVVRLREDMFWARLGGLR